MSSKLQLKKACEYCKETFIAKKSSTKYCCHTCNSKAYKDSIRKLKTKISEQNLIQKVVQASPILLSVQQKQFLDIKETCILLKCSESTLRKLISNGSIPTLNIGRKHIIRRSDIDSLFNNQLRNEL